MYRRTLNNKSSIPRENYSSNEQNENKTVPRNVFIKEKDYNDVDFAKKYSNNTNNKLRGNNTYYPNNNTPINNDSYIQYAYPYGNMIPQQSEDGTTYNNHNYYYNSNSNMDENSNTAYYPNNKNYIHQSYKYNKNNQEPPIYPQQRRSNSNKSASNNDYLKASSRYFEDIIDIQYLKALNNNKPLVSVQPSSYNKNKNNNNKFGRSINNKNHFSNLHNLPTQIASNNKSIKDKHDSFFKLISKTHNTKRRSNKPILHVAGINTLPVYSFEELIKYEPIKESQPLTDSSDQNNNQLGNVEQTINIDLNISDDKMFFKQFMKNNVEEITSNDNNRSNNITSGNTTHNTNTKKSRRTLVQSKVSNQFNKSFQQYNNDSFDLSFDGKAMDRSDYFRMVDSFSIAFDNDRDPNTTNPNITANGNGNNGNSKSFTLSKNILPEEMTNNLVY